MQNNFINIEHKEQSPLPIALNFYYSVIILKSVLIYVILILYVVINGDD